MVVDGGWDGREVFCFGYWVLGILPSVEVTVVLTTVCRVSCVVRRVSYIVGLGGEEWEGGRTGT